MPLEFKVNLSGQFSAHMDVNPAGFILSFPYLFEFWSFVSQVFMKMKKVMLKVYIYFLIFIF